MSSKIDILSSSFLLLGHNAVNNIGDNAPEAVINASFLYDMYYPSLLTRYPWRFALKQFELNKLTNPESLDGYSYAYELPSDLLAISRVDPLTPYLLYGNLLYSNISSNLTLFYTHRVSESMLPDYYVEFLIEKFAEILSMKLTQQPSLVQLWGKSADDKLNRAIAIDAQSQPSLVIASNPIAVSKYGSITGS